MPRVWRAGASLMVLALLAAGCGGNGTGSAASSGQPVASTATADERPVVTVHKSATCGCCGVYEDYLEAEGYEVDVVIADDVDAVMDTLGVPDDMRSCHVSEIGGYLAVGHVPVEALEELLTQRPEVDGITLPGMPAGSPAMPGEKDGPFEVRAFTDGEDAGELGQY